MANKVRSVRGVVVDFDLLRIKDQMQNAPAPSDVKKRENFIDKKRRRNTKKSVAAIMNTQLVSKMVKPVEPTPIVDAVKADISVTPIEATAAPQQIIKK